MNTLHPAPPHPSAAPRRTRLLPALLLVVAMLPIGCAPRYTITLTNGNTITTHGKPKLSPGRDALVFKDAKGQWQTIPTGKVTQVAPR